MSFEIPTQRNFNNLIKQNQKLDSDSVLNQSILVFRVQSPECSVRRPEASFQRAASRLQCPESSVQHLRPKNPSFMAKKYLSIK